MIEVLLLAIALSMDAFAVSIGLGSKNGANPKENNSLRGLAFKCACYFGLLQGLMPLFGYLGGHSAFGWVEVYANWIAFALLLLIGVKMVFESFSEGIEEDISQITHRVLLMLAIATSIDALAAGFTLTLLPVNALLACTIIGVTTFGFSWLGVYVGNKTGTALESRAERVGGIVLIFISIKFLLV